MTKIEWTEATWNPIVGCSVVSPGCTNCYAMKTAARLAKNPATPHYAGTVQDSRAGPVWTGKVALAEKALFAPLKRRKPTMYFVNSMGDLFHEDIPEEWIDRVFAIMALCPRHTFQVLTKRADRMRSYLTSHERRMSAAAYASVWHATGAWNIPDDVSLLWPLPNVWLGVSAEDQERADLRISDLLATPAAVRFVSVEPMLGAVDLTWLHAIDNGDGVLDSTVGRHWEAVLPPWGAEYRPRRRGHTDRMMRRQFIGKVVPRLDWVICGGESGSHARPMHPDWPRSLRDQCNAAGVPFFFKQWGAWLPEDHVIDANPPDRVFNSCDTRLDDYGMRWYRVGKKHAGRLLDGGEWNEMPEVAK
ncbi:DUF5131 family protein [Rhodobacterales bacterium HKCCE4037]|nr:DUF5131 family protein [Rhodobacterales bacterium HKCCE4037]